MNVKHIQKNKREKNINGNENKIKATSFQQNIYNRVLINNGKLKL